MMRLFVFGLLVALVITGIVILVSSAQSLMQPAHRPAHHPMPHKKEDPMPATIRTFAYMILLLLMFGVVTGWLGAV